MKAFLTTMSLLRALALDAKEVIVFVLIAIALAALLGYKDGQQQRILCDAKSAELSLPGLFYNNTCWLNAGGAYVRYRVEDL